MAYFKNVLLVIVISCISSGTVVPAGPIRKKPVITYSQAFKLETVTVYNPVSSQCDATPLITASNQCINRTKLRAGAIRWMALSRDLLKKWGGALHYGDTVYVNSGDPKIDGHWVIQDTMNKRFRNRGDLLFDAKTRTTGKWLDVTITTRKRLIAENTASVR
jgi:hypothetical protein